MVTCILSSTRVIIKFTIIDYVSWLSLSKHVCVSDNNFLSCTFWLANFKCGVSFCARDRAHKKALMSEDLVIQGQSHLQLVGRSCIL